MKQLCQAYTGSCWHICFSYSAIRLQQGVWEKDEVRKDDSFVTFEEILDIARQQDVDFVLLAGDLFHDNSPSRPTLNRAIDIFSRACFNDRPISFQLLSERTTAFANK